MKETLAVIKRMQDDGIIGSYAIGGAVGATFYLEPVATMDIDVFVSFKQPADGPLISLSPLYSYLNNLGYEARGEYVVIDGWPVQFLPPSNPLTEDAIAEAIATDVGGILTHVMTAEYLVAIALQVGRAKDMARILQFLEADVLDANTLDSILKRHGLLEKWEAFKQKFIRD